MLTFPHMPIDTHICIQCAKAALRTIIDPVAFPTGFTIADKLVAVTFARVGCFSKAYAKTTWSFSEEEADGKRQEYQYWDDNAYGAVFDDPAYRSALETKQLDDTKAADVDAFLSSLEKDHPAEVVKAPPAISLNLFGSVYARLPAFVQYSFAWTFKLTSRLSDHKG